MPINVEKLKREQKIEAKELANTTPSVTVANPPTPEVIPQDQIVAPQSSETPEVIPQTVSQSEPTPEPKPQEDQVQKLLTELGIKSIDEIRELKKRASQEPEEIIVTKTPDQIEAEAIDYAVKNGKLTLDEYTKRKEQAKSDDMKLVYDDFAEKLKAKNRNISDADIQRRFDRKFGDEITTLDGDGNPIVSVNYDDSDIKSAAKGVRENLLNPILSVKSEYENNQKAAQTEASIQKEFNKIKNDIPDSVKYKFGDTEFQYQIDDKLKPELQQEFKDRYVAYRKLQAQQGITQNENFDVKTAYAAFVRDKMFNNIITAYSQQREDSAVFKALEPFKNPVTKPLETTGQSAPKKEFNEKEQLDYIKRKKRGY